MKKTIAIVVAIVVIVGAGYYFYKKSNTGSAPSTQAPLNTTQTQQSATETPATSEATSTDDDQFATTEVIGTSKEKRDITAYHFGNGKTEILFVGGIHGGYEWNTALVAYQLIDYLKANPSSVPENERITVIPALNPDGLFKVAGTAEEFTAADVSTDAAVAISGRFNANNVDLNRNFDCDWQPSGVWQNKTVSGGKAAFSEPESDAMRKYVTGHDITAAIVWYSAAGGVFSSNCHSGILPETSTLTTLYAQAADYKPYSDFNFYEITGDMVNWLAKNDVPAISVLLTNHTDTEWDKNLAGIEAVLRHYAE